MGRVVSVHSSRGGTGKTLISVNLAAILARKGRNVSLFDMDFRAPSLSTVFKVGDHRLIKYWVNDFLNGDCPIDKTMIDPTSRYNTKGKFLVGLANPSIEAIREMMTKDRIWEREALRRLLRLKPILLNNMEVDYAIYDTSPGVQYSSLLPMQCPVSVGGYFLWSIFWQFGGTFPHLGIVLFSTQLD